MIFRKVWFVVPLGVVFVLIGISTAQRGRRDYYDRDYSTIHDRRGIPQWTNPNGFQKDVFTFVRIKYSSWSYGRGGGWRTDYPDSDLNFSFRLQQLTSFKVSPEPIVLELTDQRLFDYPFIYIVEPGQLAFDHQERLALRRYLNNGGFLMVDDFWGGEEYDNFYREIKQVFPDREPVDLPLDHAIFHSVYDLKEKPQVPSLHAAWQGRDFGITWEPRPDDTSKVNYRAILDDDQRIMVVICHNTDLGDGWEREGEDEWYFREFAEKKAYPLGINIVTYAMTH